jgi:hypothetical protein
MTSQGVNCFINNPAASYDIVHKQPLKSAIPRYLSFNNIVTRYRFQSNYLKLRLYLAMSLSQKPEANEKHSTPYDTSDELLAPMNPFTPTKPQIILFLLGLFFALDRKSIIQVLPFQIGLLGGIIPPECLMWTAIIADMARKDIFNVWRDINGISAGSLDGA